jgi:hypothetical protein
MTGQAIVPRMLLGLAAVTSLASLTLPSRSGPTGRGVGEMTGAPQLASLASLPKPEPLLFAPLAADKARLINAAIPFAASVGPASRSFSFSGTPESRGRAVDCLASAMIYEAGGDERGQRAVAQVILNRTRHPAYPASVCGVVFQGSERSTGCQFTFTCDGAMLGQPSLAAMTTARARAASMLDGSVDKDVGLATHYHTDWVHPVWSAELEKIAQVDTHLFFRWKGSWGGPGALRQRYSSDEPAIAKLAAISPVHRAGLDPQVAALAMAAAAGPGMAVPSQFTSANPARVLPDSAGQAAGVFNITMVPGGNGGVQAMIALDLCDKREFCKVMGRVSGATYTGVSQDVVFLYVRDRRTGVERSFWDCSTFKRGNSAQCFAADSRSWINFNGNLQSARTTSTKPAA